MNKLSCYRLRLPAEWERQSGVQLTWAHEGTDWAPYLREITGVLVELAKIITMYERLIVVAPSVSEVKASLMETLDDIQQANLRFLECDTNDTWARDHGAITLVSDTGENTLLDFKFNGWGGKFPYALDNLISKKLCDNGFLAGEMVDYNDFVLEGGSIESDGRGTVFTTSQCLLAKNRNQPLTRDEVDGKLREALNAERIVWLDHGNLIGDDTDGHIDTIVRVAPNDNLLYVGCDDMADEQYEDFLLLENQLRELRTTGGKPYHLRRLPMPDAIYYAGERLPATYANFLIINRAVICPTYNQPVKDVEAMRVIGEAFPGRRVFGVNARAVTLQHGSLHCLTMQYPDGVIE